MNEKINVLHLICNFNVGGAEKLILEFLKNEYLKEKINSFLCVIQGDVDEELQKEILLHNIKNTIFPKNMYIKKFATLIKLMNLIKQNKIDLIHVHEGTSEKWAILLKFFMPKIKIIHTIHDTKILTMLSPLQMLFSKKITNKIIAVSKSILDECILLSFENAVHIDNGINLKAYYKNKNKMTNEILKIINISRLTLPKKGQDILIKALSECKKKGLIFHCNIVGGTYDYDSTAPKILNDLVKENLLENEISFLGQRTDIPNLLSDSDLFILPSRYEGLPLVLLEAMASGLPVIASNIISNKNLINNNINGILFENEDVNNLADKIINLSKDKQKMDKIALEGYNFVQNFDINKMCKNYYKIYSELCKGK